MIARAANVGQRTETCDERADRLWMDLMHEVRVVLTAVQLLFAFLLAAVFTPAYERLDHTERLLYLLCLVSGAGALVALTGPVALHRLVTGLKVKTEAVAWASRLVTVALALLLTMTSLGLLVVMRQITGAFTALLLTIALTLWCGLCWGVPAFLLRRNLRIGRQPSHRHDPVSPHDVPRPRKGCTSPRPMGPKGASAACPEDRRVPRRGAP
ncbi:hypothetical protein GCM10023235_66850 [Kitasatospora terrestris]|uniref:Integral membrane protein n=2 Tax=Kitasatospora terrestris TaxID=258051 RepID=A0ABP9EI11_9ACTN